MLKRVLSLFIVVHLLSACNQQKTEVTENQPVETDIEKNNTLDNDLQDKLNMIISNNMLVPVTIISDLKSDGKSLYHPEYLNSLDNIPQYTDEFSKALNFGVYGVDIIYDIAHSQNNKIIDYREKTKALATDLGLDSFYVEDDMVKFNTIVNDDNAVSKFVFDEFHKIDDFLISHDRFETMTLMLVGGIIESMYFTGQAIEEYGMSDLKYSLLLNERNSINQLVDLLSNFKSNEKDQKLRIELEKLQDAFSTIQKREDLTPEKIKELDKLVIALRNKITNNKI